MKRSGVLTRSAIHPSLWLGAQVASACLRVFTAAVAARSWCARMTYAFFSGATKKHQATFVVPNNKIGGNMKNKNNSTTHAASGKSNTSSTSKVQTSLEVITNVPREQWELSGVSVTRKDSPSGSEQSEYKNWKGDVKPSIQGAQHMRAYCLTFTPPTKPTAVESLANATTFNC